MVLKKCSGALGKCRRLASIWGEKALVLLLAMLVLLVYENPTVHVDELYHIIPAQSLLDDGTLIVDQQGEPYTRAWAYTYMVAASYGIFGENVWAARLPSMIAGALLVLVVFSWASRVAGKWAGYSAVGLLCLSPGFINLANMSRFYTLQALAVALVAVGVYKLAVRRMGCRERLTWTATVLLAGWLAIHVQESTIVAFGMLGLWSAAIGAMMWIRSVPLGCRRPRIYALMGGGVVALVLFLGMLAAGLWDGLWYKYRHTPAWADANKNNITFYYRLFLTWYPAFWYLLPLAIVVALRHYWSAAWLCLAVFGGAFVVHSLGGMKAERYIIYAYPFMWMIWGMALQRVIPDVKQYYETVCRRLVGSRHMRWGIQLVAWGGVAGTAVLIMHNTPAYYLSRQWIAHGNVTENNPYLEANWAQAASTLHGYVAQSGQVITSSPAMGIYYLGRTDLALSYTEREGRKEGAKDWRTGRPVISSREALANWMEESADGLIVVEAQHFGQPWAVPQPAADYILEHTQEIPLPEASGIRAFRWNMNKEAPEDPVTSEPTAPPDAQASRGEGS